MNSIGCKCLNIIIETETYSIPSVKKDQLQLAIEEEEDIFFRKENLLLVEALNNINKSVPGLVETREVGSWIIHYCINCKIYTHAVHKEKGASYVVANSNLLTADVIRKLKNSEHYSKIHAIIIDTSQCDEENDETFYPDGVEPIVMDLKQTLTETMRKEAALVDERIRTFTEEQYSMLDNLRDRLYNEERVLIRNLALHFAKNPKEETNGQKIKISDAESQIENIDSKCSQSTPMCLRNAPKRQKGTPEQNNYDILFQFDSADDNSLQREDDVESDDVDDTQNKNRDQYQSRRRSNDTNIAKSLPMDIPVFMRGRSKEGDECEDEILLLEEETDVDIADSIKKIARSVHGGGIFGDLPRPRFSTQL